MMVITDFAVFIQTPKVSAETKITSIFKNECVVAMAFLKDASGNLWYYVKTRNGQKGYVRSESLCIYMPEEAPAIPHVLQLRMPFSAPPHLHQQYRYRKGLKKIPVWHYAHL